ncbi:hypothetical protein FM020_05415 [Acinetobacter tandoii]|nr:hypothetical protein FM020_05415 [Acinetobacter tandoii]
MIRNTLVAAALISFSTISFADALPAYKDYPATVYKGKTAKLLINNDTAKSFRTRLSAALKDEPEFAGEYVMAVWGCGTSCVMQTFVSKRTGQVVEHGFGAELGQNVIGIKPDSRLLIAHGYEYDHDYNATGEYDFYYVFENGKFKLIKKVDRVEEQ